MSCWHGLSCNREVKQRTHEFTRLIFLSTIYRFFFQAKNREYFELNYMLTVEIDTNHLIGKKETDILKVVIMLLIEFHQDFDNISQ